MGRRFDLHVLVLIWTLLGSSKAQILGTQVRNLGPINLGPVPYGAPTGFPLPPMPGGLSYRPFPPLPPPTPLPPFPNTFPRPPMTNFGISVPLPPPSVANTGIAIPLPPPSVRSTGITIPVPPPSVRTTGLTIPLPPPSYGTIGGASYLPPPSSIGLSMPLPSSSLSSSFSTVSTSSPTLPLPPPSLSVPSPPLSVPSPPLSLPSSSLSLPQPSIFLPPGFSSSRGFPGSYPLYGPTVSSSFGGPITSTFGSTISSTSFGSLPGPIGPTISSGPLVSYPGPIGPTISSTSLDDSVGSFGTTISGGPTGDFPGPYPGPLPPVVYPPPSVPLPPGPIYDGSSTQIFPPPNVGPGPLLPPYLRPPVSGPMYYPQPIDGLGSSVDDSGFPPTGLGSGAPLPPPSELLDFSPSLTPSTGSVSTFQRSTVTSNVAGLTNPAPTFGNPVYFPGTSQYLPSPPVFGPVSQTRVDYVTPPLEMDNQELNWFTNVNAWNNLLDIHDHPILPPPDEVGPPGPPTNLIFADGEFHDHPVLPSTTASSFGNPLSFVDGAPGSQFPGLGPSVGPMTSPFGTQTFPTPGVPSTVFQGNVPVQVSNLDGVQGYYPGPGETPIDQATYLQFLASQGINVDAGPGTGNPFDFPLTDAATGVAVPPESQRSGQRQVVTNTTTVNETVTSETMVTYVEQVTILHPTTGRVCFEDKNLTKAQIDAVVALISDNLDTPNDFCTREIPVTLADIQRIIRNPALDSGIPFSKTSAVVVSKPPVKITLEPKRKNN